MHVTCALSNFVLDDDAFELRVIAVNSDDVHSLRLANLNRCASERNRGRHCVLSLIEMLASC